jgi:hypothetical protein
MAAHRAAIREIVAENRPCSVRQVYYIGIGRLWEKDVGSSRRAYKDLVRVLGTMREDTGPGRLPWGWLVDSTRWVRIAEMYGSVDEAVDGLAASYLRDPWVTQPHRVESWAESDSIAAVLEPTTFPLRVGLHSCRGQAGKEFVYEAAQQQRRDGRPVTVLYVGDWDPTGLSIPRSVDERLARYSAGGLAPDFVTLAVTAADVAGGRYAASGHVVNQHDPNFLGFRARCEAAGLDPLVGTPLWRPRRSRRWSCARSWLAPSGPGSSRWRGRRPWLRSGRTGPPWPSWRPPGVGAGSLERRCGSRPAGAGAGGLRAPGDGSAGGAPLV